MAFLWVAYAVYETAAPAYNVYVYVAFAIGITLQAAIWRFWLLRRSLSFEQLYVLDATFTIGANLIIAVCAVIAFDRRPSAYTCLIYTCWTVLTRALVVPSTGTRTAVVTAIAMLPMGIAGGVLSQIATWPGPKDVPPLGLLVGYAQIATVAVLLSASGSRIIYGLRQKITAAEQLGQYKLVREIGRGGMGTVHHALLRRPTAIKLLSPEKIGHDTLQRFEREVQHMSQLSHPNTVTIYHYGHSLGGVFYYAMEYLGGGIDLENLVHEHGRQPAERVRQILLQVCGALQEAHDRGLIHRDIKPPNIILCERGAMPDVAKVVDFGLVKEVTAETGASTQVILGTPAYLAPEAVTDPSTVGPAADLYALGAVGYFLLAGRRVFDGTTAIELCIQHATKQPQPLSALGIDVPRELERILLWCLAKQPSERPASAQAVADALRDAGPFSDWDEARATAWWATFRPLEASGHPTAAPLTVDIVREKAA